MNLPSQPLLKKTRKLNRYMHSAEQMVEMQLNPAIEEWGVTVIAALGHRDTAHQLPTHLLTACLYFII